MLYLALEYLHVLGAIVILGTGTGIAKWPVRGKKTRQVRQRWRRGPTTT
jgi:uncharacterized membrane protein